uniref:Uncharacterized protein n=1 Tax=Lepeophtheirus salmonis TaxID=72036 RepID=A0A0K2SZD3_LEPSM
MQSFFCDSHRLLFRLRGAYIDFLLHLRWVCRELVQYDRQVHIVEDEGSRFHLRI